MRTGWYEENRPIMEKFWERVDIKSPDLCWNWMKGRFKSGYGVVELKGCNKVYAHRMAKLGLLALEPANRQELVLHKCNNKLCCNPDHLYLGNDAENRQKYFADGNKGTKFGTGRLKHEDVVEIRKLKAEGWRIIDIARKFNYNPSTLRKVISGEIYSPHLYGY